MEKIHFLFGVHNHQPVGNFDDVFEKGCAGFYKPFISILEKHPLIKASIHFSDSLLEWSEKKDPEFIETVQHLVEKTIKISPYNLPDRKKKISSVVDFTFVKFYKYRYA